jgi:glycerate kinase
MHFIVAPDSYKGSVSAVEVALAMERGILQVFPSAKVRKIPIADGGEGTVEALVTATGGQYRSNEVAGPLGERIQAAWGVLGGGKTAVIEMATASGLPLVPADRRDPRKASSYGTGELIRAALDAGIRQIIIGIGGSATNDAGTGMARALGARGRWITTGGRRGGAGRTAAHVKVVVASVMQPTVESRYHANASL